MTSILPWPNTTAESAPYGHIEDVLTSVLHGSGFNGTWHVSKQVNGLYRASIGYSCMSEHGCYDGVITVNVTFDDTWNVKRVTFSCDSSTRRKYLYDRYYFDDSVEDVFETIRQDYTTVSEVPAN